MRFLLDTNVVSEVVHGDRRVLAKLSMHQGACAIAATTWYELHRGAGLMKPGRKREHVDRFIRELTLSDYPILPFDAAAAAVQARAAIFFARRNRVLGYPDAQIASVAVSNKLTLATRNIRHFEDFPDLRLDNWFD